MLSKRVHKFMFDTCIVMALLIFFFISFVPIYQMISGWLLDSLAGTGDLTKVNNIVGIGDVSALVTAAFYVALFFVVRACVDFFEKKEEANEK